MTEHETTKHFEVLMLLGRPPTNVDPQDSTGSGYRPPTPNTYRVRLIASSGSGPSESHKTLEDLGVYPHPDAARAAIKKRQEQDPDLEGVPIRYIS